MRIQVSLQQILLHPSPSSLDCMLACPAHDYAQIEVCLHPRPPVTNPSSPTKPPTSIAWLSEPSIWPFLHSFLPDLAPLLANAVDMYTAHVYNAPTPATTSPAYDSLLATLVIAVAIAIIRATAGPDAQLPARQSDVWHGVPEAAGATSVFTWAA